MIETIPRAGPLPRRLPPHPRDLGAALWFLARWTCLVTPGAVGIGAVVALFLWMLDRATLLRWEYPWLLWLLPAGGLLVGALYHSLAHGAERGSNLVMDEIHEPGGGVPARMTPLVFAGTVLTHLFGGSAGREGTAVQMGGSVASVLARLLRLNPADTSILLTTGIAAGFGAVFGTPVTGAVFALEVLTAGRVSYRALVPCLAASLIADRTVALLGVHHTLYRVASLSGSLPAGAGAILMAKVALAAVAFGLASALFAEATHAVSDAFARTVRWPVLRPVIGGVVVILLVLALDTRDYLGLGVTTPDPRGVSILSSFAAGGAPPFAWLWKIVFTAVTLGSGFRGGEVTPLFFVGATLGSALAGALHAPPDLFAALGFVAVFAGATNTPLACTLMGVELFGTETTAYFATACFLSYLFSGRSGIYSAQRVAEPKLHRPHDSLE